MKEIYNLIIEQTATSPSIDLNQLTGNLILSGRSIPENAAKVYEPILNWVKDYTLHARPTTNFRLDLEYFNTASSIWLAKIIKTLVGIKSSDCVFILHLYLTVEDFDSINEYDDIKDVFNPIISLDYGGIDSIGIKLYGIDKNRKIIKESLVCLEQKHFSN